MRDDDARLRGRARRRRARPSAARRPSSSPKLRSASALAVALVDVAGEHERRRLRDVEAPMEVADLRRRRPSRSREGTRPYVAYALFSGKSSRKTRRVAVHEPLERAASSTSSIVRAFSLRSSSPSKRGSRTTCERMPSASASWSFVTAIARTVASKSVRDATRSAPSVSTRRRSSALVIARVPPSFSMSPVSVADAGDRRRSPSRRARGRGPARSGSACDVTTSTPMPLASFARATAGKGDSFVVPDGGALVAPQASLRRRRRRAPRGRRGCRPWPGRTSRRPRPAAAARRSAEREERGRDVAGCQRLISSLPASPRRGSVAPASGTSRRRA